MNKVIICKGLPGSGKSSWSKKMQAKFPGQYKRVNKDDLRAMLDDGKWSKGNERFVVALRNEIILRALEDGKDVICDDTNLAPKHEAQIRELIKDKAIVEVKEFNTPIEDCIKNDLKRQHSVGEKVIRDMYRQFILPKMKYAHRGNLPGAIIVDIDGTMAKMNGRSAYDWSRVGEDSPNYPVVQIVLDYMEKHSGDVLFVSGRDGVCREATTQWLANLGCYGFELYMRPPGNLEKDAVIKRRIFDEFIRDRYDVEYVLDDRDQTVEMWRSLGLTCLQVDYGNF